MDAVLKKNIRQILILMLISAVTGLLVAVSFFLADGKSYLPVYAAFAYGVLCTLVWVLGTVKVIWQLPFKRVWRIICGFIWLIIYPCLAYLWLSFCLIGFLVGFSFIRN